MSFQQGVGGTAAQPGYPAQPPKKKRGLSGCVVALIVVCVVGTLGLGLMVLLLAVAAGAASEGLSKEGQFRFREITVRSGGPRKVYVVPVDGIIASRGAFADGDPVAIFKEQLKRAERDSNCAAVIVSIDSPGGGITATDIMYRAVLGFKERTGKPVVACMMDVAASGGYYLASACDTIIAHPSTLTGSIGVIMPLYDVTGLMSKVGVQARFVTSGRFKTMGSPFVQRTPDEEAADRALLQTMVDDMYAQFVGVVARGRKMTPDQVRKLADGRVYTGAQAQQNGLVDQLGYFEDAVAAAERLSGTSGTRVIVSRRIVSFVEVLTGQAQARARAWAPVRLEELFTLSFGKPLYLWINPEPAAQP